MRVALAAALLMALPACHEEPTGVIVEVTSDLALPASAELHLLVSSNGRPVSDLPFHAADLPARLEIAPGKASTSVTVEAIAPVNPPLSRKATVGFRKGSLVLLRLPLEAACVCVACDDGWTCESGQCASVVKDVGSLSVYAPRTPLDASAVAAPVCGDGGRSAPEGGAAPPPPRPDGAEAPGPYERIDGAPGAEVLPPAPDARADLAPPADGAPPPPDGAPPPPPDLGPPPPPPPDAAPVADAPADSAAPPPDAAGDPPPPPDTSPPSDPIPLRNEGDPCATSDQCLSRACVDHVCCRSACTGPCLACDSLHTGVPSGQCAPVLAGTDPDGDCTGDMPMTCGYDGTCNGAGACRFYTSATQCAAAVCNGSTFTPARSCTGAGACTPPAPQDCGMFKCTSSGCPATCSSQGACVDSAYCNGSSCVAKKAALQPCANGYECVSGSCSLTLVCL